MNGPVRYREVQHFGLLFYAATVLLGGMLLILSSVEMLGGADSMSILLPAVPGVLLLIVAAAYGRIVISVTGHALHVETGWLGLGRCAVDLAHIQSVRVYLFNSVTSRGWRWPLRWNGLRCYRTTARRGLELSVSGKRILLGTGAPQALKQAVLQTAEAADERPEPRKHAVRLPRRRRTAALQTWCLITPEQTRGSTP